MLKAEGSFPGGISSTSISLLFNPILILFYQAIFPSDARVIFLRDKADHVIPLLKLFHSNIKNYYKIRGKEQNIKWYINYYYNCFLKVPSRP